MSALLLCKLLGFAFYIKKDDNSRALTFLEAKSINGFFKLQLTNLLLLLIVFQGFRNTKRHFKYY